MEYPTVFPDYLSLHIGFVVGSASLSSKMDYLVLQSGIQLQCLLFLPDGGLSRMDCPEPGR
jgi:hypothetical protein